jgi:two-component system chemotaxis response regulator CheY
MNVLVADDEPTTRAILRHVLKRELSCTVVEAVDGLAALKALDQQPFGLVVTDLGMPEVTGLELLEAIRGDSSLAALPVVIMSAERSEETVRAAIRLGIQGYLAKPIDVTVVTAKLESIVQTAAARRDHSTHGDSAVNPNGTFLVVDGNGDFRQMFASAFSIERPVVEAATGVEALVQAANTSPAAIFVGSDVGLLAGGLLIRKLLNHDNLQQTKIVAIQSTHSSERVPGVHATIVRSVGPESFRAQVESIFRPSPPDESFPVPQA